MLIVKVQDFKTRWILSVATAAATRHSELHLKLARKTPQWGIDLLRPLQFTESLLLPSSFATRTPVIATAVVAISRRIVQIKCPCYLYRCAWTSFPSHRVGTIWKTILPVARCQAPVEANQWNWLCDVTWQRELLRMPVQKSGRTNKQQQTMAQKLIRISLTLKRCVW